MSSARDLLLRLVLQNLNVIEQINDVKKTVDDINGSRAVVAVSADVTVAKKQLEDTKSSIRAVTDEIAKTNAGANIFSRSLSDTSKEGGALSGVMGQVRSSVGAVKNAMAEAGNAGKAAAVSLKQNWSEVQGALQKTAAATAAVTIGAIYAHEGVSRNIRTIGTVRGEDFSREMTDWIQGAGSQTVNTVSASNRSAAALEAAKQFSSLNASQTKEFVELLEKEMLRETGSTESLPNVIQLIGTGNLERLRKTLPGLGIDEEKLKAQAKAYYENPAYMRSHSQYKSEEDVLAGLFAEEFTKKATTEKLPTGKTLAETGFEEFDTAPLEKAQIILANIANTLGNELEPYLVAAVNALALFNTVIQNTPGATTFIALSIAITSIVTSALLAAAGIKSFVEATHLATIATKAYNAALAATRVVMTLVSSHPLLAIFLLLVSALILVEAKTGIFSKGLSALAQAATPAWQALMKVWEVLSSSGGEMLIKVISGVAGALGTLAGIAAGGLKNLWGGISAKIGLDTADFKSALKVGFMAAFPVAGLAVMATHIPSISKNILESLSKSDVISGLINNVVTWIGMLYDLLKPWVGIFNSIYKTLADFWAWVVNLPDLILSKLPSWLGGTGSTDKTERYNKLSKELPDYLQELGHQGLSDEQIDYLAKYASGMDVSGIDASALGISDIMRKDAMSFAKKSGSRGSVVGFSGVTQEVAEANDWLANNVYQNPTLNTVNPYPALSKEDLIDDKIYYNITGVSLTGKALKSADFDLKNWYDPDSTPIQKHAEGGRVLRSGIGIIHAGERIERADVVREESTLERMITALSSGAKVTQINSESRAAPQLVIQGPLIGEAKIDSELDIDTLAEKLLWVMRNRLEDLMERSIGLKTG